jgi:hypothetical protein
MKNGYGSCATLDDDFSSCAYVRHERTKVARRISFRDTDHLFRHLSHYTARHCEFMLRSWRLMTISLGRSA